MVPPTLREDLAVPRSATLADFFEREVLPQLDAETVYHDVEFFQTDGRVWRGRCPFHASEETENGFSVDAETLRWSCEHCGERAGQSVLAYLNGGTFPSADSPEYRKAVDRAASLIEVEVPDLPLPSAEQARQALACEQQTQIQEAFFLQTYQLFHESEPEHRGQRAAARRFLRQRGFPLEELPQVPLGLMIEPSAMRHRLADAGFTREEIEASHLVADDRLAGRLIGPVRDAQGRIVNFWARHPGDERPAYLFLTGNWKQQVPAFGLDIALGEADKPLVLVEGLLDALLLQALGLRHGAAVGGRIAELTRQRWQQLGGLDVAQAVLVPTRRKGVDAELAAAAEMSLSSAGVPEVWVVPPEALGEAASLADYATREGVEAAEALLERDAITGLRFLALELLGRHRAGKRWTKRSREAALEEAHRIYNAHRADHEESLIEHFVPPILEALRLDSFPVVEETAEPEPEPAEEPAVAEAEPAPEPEPEPQFEPEPAAGASSARTVADELPDHQRWLQRHQGQDVVGLPQRTLRTLDHAVQGLRGLMLLAGPAGVGKTALGLQWGLDVVRHNPEACFLFVSLEMPRGQLVTRLLCRMARVPWKRLVLGGPGVLEGDGYTPAELRRLERAEEELRLWGRRMLVLDDANCPQPSLESVAEQLARLKAESGAQRAFVLVDHLRLWPAGDSDDPARMRAMQLLHHASPDDALLVLAETPAGETIDPARFGGVPDLLLTLRPFSRAELAEALSQFSRGAVSAEACRAWQDDLDRRGRTLNRLAILGGRDGVRRTELELTFSYRYSTFREGVAAPPRPGMPVLSPASPPATVEAIAPPAVAMPADRLRTRPGECPLHHCSIYDCFCFD